MLPNLKDTLLKERKIKYTSGKKALYGLKQALWAWYGKIDSHFQESGIWKE